MSIAKGLTEAADDCFRYDYAVTITLKSGVQFTGDLDRLGELPSLSLLETVDLHTERGCVTIDVDQIAAVGAEQA